MATAVEAASHGQQHSIPFHAVPAINAPAEDRVPSSSSSEPAMEALARPPMHRTVSHDSAYSHMSASEELEHKERHHVMQKQGQDVLILPGVKLPHAKPPASAVVLTAAPSKPAATKAAPKKKAATSRAKAAPGEVAEAVSFLAPDYTLNPAGPASSTNTTFQCPKCDKQYKGKHARSIWRRHLQDKHGIPLSAQPKRTRWDSDTSATTKTDAERRQRTLASKREWAKKNRASKGNMSLGSGDTSSNAGGSDFGGEEGSSGMLEDSSFEGGSQAFHQTQSPYLAPLHEQHEEMQDTDAGSFVLDPSLKQKKAALGVKDANAGSRPSSAAGGAREPVAVKGRKGGQSLAHLLSSPGGSEQQLFEEKDAAEERPTSRQRREGSNTSSSGNNKKRKASSSSRSRSQQPPPRHSSPPPPTPQAAYAQDHHYFYHPPAQPHHHYSPMPSSMAAGSSSSASGGESFEIATPGPGAADERHYYTSSYAYGAPGYGYGAPFGPPSGGMGRTPYGYGYAGAKDYAGGMYGGGAAVAAYGALHPPPTPPFAHSSYHSQQRGGYGGSFQLPPPSASHFAHQPAPPPRAPASLALPFSSPVSRNHHHGGAGASNSLSSYALSRDTGSSLLSSPAPAAHELALDLGSRPRSSTSDDVGFPLSSPAHPELSMQLGLSALPGPGVVGLYPTVGADTPLVVRTSRMRTETQESAVGDLKGRRDRDEDEDEDAGEKEMIGDSKMEQGKEADKTGGA